MALIFIFLVVLTALYLFRRSQRLPLPPGPTGIPFVGSLNYAPAVPSSEEYRDWHRKYGPVISMRCGQRVVIALGSYQAARDLLEKRSAIYSSRPRLVIYRDVIAKGLHSGLLPFGPRWEKHRRAQSHFLSPRIMRQAEGLLQLESTQLIFDLLSTNAFMEQSHRCIASVMLTLMYGRRITTVNDPLLKETDGIFGEAYLEMMRGSLIEAFPILNRLPKWLAPWQRRGDQIHKTQVAFFQEQMSQARQRSGWNWTKESSTLKETQDMSAEELGYVVGTLYEAGVNAIDAVLPKFLPACILHPEAVQLVQSELDEMVGSRRLPQLGDAAALPMTHAFIQELLRWRPFTSMNTPHAADQDDEYMGYHIPKGATVGVTPWTLEMEESIFSQAHEFRPERWLRDPNVPVSTWGYGKRYCLGKQLARNYLFCTISRLLWAYDIADQADLPPTSASFSVRSLSHQRIIESEWKKASTDLPVIM